MRLFVAVALDAAAVEGAQTLALQLRRRAEELAPGKPSRGKRKEKTEKAKPAAAKRTPKAKK